MFHRITTLGCSFGKMRLCERQPQRLSSGDLNAQSVPSTVEVENQTYKETEFSRREHVALKNLSYAVNN